MGSFTSTLFGHPVDPLTLTFEAGQPTAAPPVSASLLPQEFKQHPQSAPILLGRLLPSTWCY